MLLRHALIRSSHYTERACEAAISLLNISGRVIVSYLPKLCSRGASIHPLGQVVARLECRLDLRRLHLGVLGNILSAFPLEKLDSILGDGLAPEVAVCRSLLVLGLAESQRHS